ncbi:hypothetical protein ACSYAD_19460 [Acaryochloris marina NIES-2412]|uniref:hypothetical protein n=1 Tax=Acaryochloris marina TaxID=155978 RepID=UPI004057D57B
MDTLFLILWLLAGIGLTASNIHLIRLGEMNWSGDINVSREKHPLFMIGFGWLVITGIGILLFHPITRLLFLGAVLLYLRWHYS